MFVQWNRQELLDVPLRAQEATSQSNGTSSHYKASAPQRKGNGFQNEEMSHKRREKLCTLCLWEEGVTQNIRVMHKSQWANPSSTINKWANHLNRHFLREGFHMTKGHMNDLTIPQWAKMRYYLTPVGLISLKRQKVTSSGEGVK